MLFEYEHSSKFILSPDSVENLLNEIDEEQFSVTPLKDRIILQEVTDCLDKKQEISVDEMMNSCMRLIQSTPKIKEEKLKAFFEDLKEFLKVEPRLPGADKEFIETEVLSIKPESTREQIIELIREKSSENEVAHLSLYAYRQMDQTDWRPFIKAALERNPVSLQAFIERTTDEAYQLIHSLENSSVYDAPRLAQPDEVWNFRRGDGLEKAFLMANFLYNKKKVKKMTLEVQNSMVTLKILDRSFEFTSEKGLTQKLELV
jgi:hypothetical protein